MTRIPFQKRRNSLFFRGANKEKNEASWSLSPEAPPGGTFLQTPAVLPAPANFPSRVAGCACPAPPLTAWGQASARWCSTPAPRVLSRRCPRGLQAVWGPSSQTSRFSIDCRRAPASEFQGKVLMGAVQSGGEKCYSALCKASPCVQINIKMACV